MPPDIPVIRTKTIIPRRRDEILTRSRLLTILDGILDLKLLILAAPAGYGKTSLLVDFTQHTQIPVCWFSLDSLDCDPARFIAHFISSIQSKYPEFGASSLEALSDLNQDRLNLDPVISAVVNDAYDHIIDNFVVVIDDYHLVRDSKPIEVFINRVIQEMADNCHFILASRTLLTLPDLSLLVARSQVDGLSFEELAFQPDELKQLMLTNYNLSLSNLQAEEMILKTEGWITGLLLTAQLSPKSNQERSRLEKVSGVGIYEYLAQQVFDRQPQEMQNYLLRTSLLEEFDAKLCQRVLEPALALEGVNWSKVVERIQIDNLFVLSVGDDSMYLRYHHLFRDFLQNRMRVERPAETARIEGELAKYYEETREWERAVTIYLRIGSTPQLVELIRKAAPSMILGGRLVSLTDWLDALPAGMADSRPELLSIRGSIAMLRGETRLSLDLLNKAIESFHEENDILEMAVAHIRRSAADRHFGNYSEALADALYAVEACKTITGSSRQHAEALRAAGLAYLQNGNLKDAGKFLHSSYQKYRDQKNESDAAKVLMEMGVVYRAQGDLDQTEKCYQDSLEYWQGVSNSMWQANVLNNLGVLQHLRGQYEQAVITYEKALTYAQLAVNPRLEAFILTGLGDLYRDVRALRESRQAYNQAEEILKITKDLSLDVYLALAIAVLGRISGDFDNADREIKEASRKADSSGSKYEENSCLLERSALLLKQGFHNEDMQLALLEKYFTSAGYEVEALKAEFLTALNVVTSGGQNKKPDLEKLLRRTRHSPKRNILIQLGFEFRTIIETLVQDDDKSTEVGSLLSEIKEFESKIPQYHRTIRRLSSSVEFAKPKLLVKGFGRMQVKVGDKTVTGADWRTHSVKDVFFYLLSHQEGVTKEEIGEAFWPEVTRETLKLRFKNTIYRMRHVIGSECITFVDEEYRFNRGIDYEYDVETFLQELSLAKNTQNPESKMDHLGFAVKNYHGLFLPKLELDWVLIKRELYHQQFIQAAWELIDLYMQRGEYLKAAKLAERAIEEDGYNEAIYRAAMQAYSALDDRTAIIRQYERCKNLLIKDLNIEPSPQTVKLYNTLMHR